MTTATAEPMTDQPYFLGVHDYLQIAKRRYLQFVLPAALVFLLAFAYIMSISPVYRSVASISVESQQIPTELVQSTVTRYSNQQIEFIRQLVLTRENVRSLIQKFSLYQDRNFDQSQQIEIFLQNVEIQIANAEVTPFASTPALSFDVAFLSESPHTAQHVTEELVALFLNENARSRSERAAETTAFLADEARKIREEMLEMEQRVAEFKRENRDSMPDIAEMNITLLDRLERDYSESSQRIEGLKGQLDLLQLEVQQYRSRMLASLGGAPSISTLQRQYDEVLLTNTEEHPDAKRLKQQLEDARTKLREVSSSGTEADDDFLLEDATYASYKSRIASLQSELNYLQEQKNSISSRMDLVQARIEQAPEVEKELTDLERDLDNLRENYEEMRDKELEARIAQSLEEGKKGERFTLLEPPILPVEPYKPDRLKLNLAAGVFSIAVGFGVVVLLQLGSSGLTSSGIQHAMGMPPLVTIPQIENEASKRQAHAKMLLLSVGAAVFVVALIIISLLTNY